MMFEPGLTRGTLEVVVAPPQHPHCAADDQSTKAIDIQNAYLNGTVARPPHRGARPESLCPDCKSPPPRGPLPLHVSQPHEGQRKSHTK